MSEFLPPVIAVLLADISGYKAGMQEAQAEAGETSGVLSKFSSLSKFAVLAIGAAAVTVGVESVKMASAFQASMVRVSTQAGASMAEVKQLTGEVLKLGYTGQTPLELADGLYHVESAGFRGAQAVSMVAAAAKLATIGNANMGDVTQAMIASIASGIPGVKDANDAAALLNETVGIGDMKMEGLAQAMSTGILPAARVAGLSFTDVAAALATITDNATPPQMAATRLRMLFSLMAAPSGVAVKALASVGIGAHQLGDDMRKPDGLLVALQDLQAHLTASGMTATQQAAVINHAFGGSRSGATIDTLMEEMDRLKTKYSELGTSSERAAKFQEAWKNTQGTFAATVKILRAELDALMVRLGLVLIPIVEKVGHVFAESVQWVLAHKAALAALAAIIGTVVVAGLTALTGAVIGFTASLLVNPLFLLVAALGALGAGIYEAYQHSAKFRAEVQHLGEVAKHWLGEAKLAFEAIFQTIKTGNGGGYLDAFSVKTGKTLTEIGTKIREFIDTAKRIWTDVYPYLKDFAEFVEAHWKPIMIAVGIAAGSIMAPLATVAAGLVYLYARFKVVRDIVADVIAFFKAAPGALEHAFDNVMHAVDNVKHAIDNILNAGGDAWDAIVHAAGNVEHAFDNVWHAGENVWHAIGDAIDWFNNGPLAYVRARIADFTSFWNSHYTEIREVARTIWAAISAYVRVAIAEISGIIKFGIATLSTIWNIAWATIRDTVKDVWPIIVAAVTGAWNVLWAVVSAGLTLLSTAWNVAWDAIKFVVKATWDAIATIAATAWKAFLDAIGVFIDLITGHWGKAWTDAKKLASDTWNGIVKLFSDFAKTAINFLVQAGTDLINGLINGVKAVGSVLLTAWHATLHFLDAFVTGALNLLYDAGKDLITGLINGIKSMAKAAMDAAKGVVNSVVGGVKSVLGINSPSLVFHEVGLSMGEGLVNGVNASTGKATQSAVALARAAALAAKQAAQQPVSFAGGLPRGILSGVGAVNAASTSTAAAGHTISYQPNIVLGGTGHGGGGVSKRDVQDMLTQDKAQLVRVLRSHGLIK